MKNGKGYGAPAQQSTAGDTCGAEEDERQRSAEHPGFAKQNAHN